MKILIILGILCVIILYVTRQTEGFEDPIEPELIDKYSTFVAFYNPFLINWEKAIVTSIGLDTPIKALTDPSQIGSAAASFTAPTRIEMNTYIQNLEKTLKKPFPPLTDALPATLDSALITELSQRPLDPSAYQNALQWMNKSLSDAHTQMEAMKSPGGFNSQRKEGFDNCAEYTKCMSDPEVLSKIAEAQNEQQAKKEKEKRKALEDKLDNINNNTIVQSEAKKNQELIEKSKEVEAQAKNGTLLNQFNLTNNDDSLSHFIKPLGLSKLEDMKKNNPAQYAANEKNNGQFLELGRLLNSISSALG
jgi:hypothetical protein